MSAVATADVARPKLVVTRPMAIVGVLVAWVVLWFLLRGQHTLYLAPADTTPLQDSLNDLRDTVDANRNTSPIFVYGFDVIRQVIDTLVTAFLALIADPSAGRPVPQIGWLGVVAIGTWLGYTFGTWRIALLVGLGLTFLGLQGLWVESMQTLALTLAAVLLCILIGVPLGIWAGLNDRVNQAITPVLDFMQTMPTFVYLAPLTLFFLIGPASATIATLIYAIPPVIRITAHGIRNVSASALESSTSLGVTRWQMLGKVQVPLAKRTIVLGVNQTMMAALSMATIAALIDAPGLGKVVLRALQSLDVGTAFNAGLAIVVLAILLDRSLTAASVRVEQEQHGGPAHPKRRRMLIIGLGVVTLFAVYLSRTYLWAAEFPSEVSIGSSIAAGVQAATEWAQLNLYFITVWCKDVFTLFVLDPLQSLFADSPFYLTGAAVLALAYLLAGVRALVVAAVCLVLIIVTGLWSDSMVTLAATLVATVVVMVLALAFGVWMGRSDSADRFIRPALDAGQTMPAFVYLVPFLGLFGSTRFTAIVAAVVYGAPVAIKLVCDGVRGVSPTAVEAATSAGSTSWQTITKVQLPMARRGVALAANQGLIYVLSMVVVGGLVGAGGLGYDVVAGFSQAQLWGKGLAAGFAIVLLGIMLDRITQSAADRLGAPN
ncbi:ABC transporter permease [Pseudonocardia sp.]|uniref:ABC transporter permease n=1 Tax=Pseudonocardia sp. TaxID=60912 RepID=UPI003D0A9822